MDVVTKATATVTPVEDSKSKHGEFDVILSTSSLDRDGDELHPDEWKSPLPDKITFDSDHGMSVATCVGSGRPFINDSGQLQVRGVFASTPHGQAVRTLVNEGHIDRVSVAFRNLPRTSKTAKPERELLNGAFVAVPANPEARVLSSKGAGPHAHPEIFTPSEKKDAVDWREDTMAAVASMFDQVDNPNDPARKSYFQGVHDLAVKLGAGCPYSDPSATPGVLAPSNRSINDEVETKSSPPESGDLSEPIAPALDTANADDEDDESADDVATEVAKALIKLRSI
jgi:hypothetical protein